MGIVGFGIITGDITSKIVEANSPPPLKMDGKKVGTLRFRDYDSYVVSSLGGYCHYNTDATDFFTDVRSLLNKLRKKEIDGFLLDRYTLWALLDPTMINAEFWFTKEEESFFNNDTLRIEYVVSSAKIKFYSIMFFRSFVCSFGVPIGRR